jgi:hypothetical protein
MLWQVQHGWPTLEFIANATRDKNVALGFGGFLLGQVMEMGPFALPFWLAGLAWLLVARQGRFRVLGVIWLVALGIFALQHGKPYYLLPAYPPLLAAAGVALESVSARWLRWGALALGCVGQAVAAPFAIPVLKVEAFVAYAEALGVKPVQQENTSLGPLPQFFADRFGWEELAQQVASAYHALSPDEQARVLLVGDNYGEAAALDYYGRRLGLPPARSQHNSYYVWAPAPEQLDLAIIIGQRPESLRSVFRSCVPVGRIQSPWAMPYEKRNPVLLCRELLLPADEAWRAGRHFI